MTSSPAFVVPVPLDKSYRLLNRGPTVLMRPAQTLALGTDSAKQVSKKLEARAQFHVAWESLQVTA